MSLRLSSLTVVIPNFNHGHVIGGQLGSVFSQSVQPERVIVFDDASTDDSVARIEELVSSRQNVEFVRMNKNSGPVALINEGLRRASTEYVCFLAADDITLPGFFAKSLAMLNQYPSAALCSAVSYVKHGAEATTWPEWIQYPSQTSIYISPTRALELLRKFENWMVIPVYRRSMLQEMGGFDPRLRNFADGFLYRVLALRHGACFVPEILTEMHLSDSGYSMSDAHSEERSSEIFVYSSALMKTQFSELFPADLIARNNARMMYRLLVLKLNNLQRSTRELVASAQPMAGGALVLVVISWGLRVLRVALFLVLRIRDTSERVRLKFGRKMPPPPQEDGR